MKSNYIIKSLDIDCNGDKDFFDLFIEWLTPKHHLTKIEQKYLAACIRNRHELSKSIADDDILDETCMNEVNRAKIRKDIGFNSQQAQNVISKLKKLKMLIPKKYPLSDRASYYKIAPSLIPNYDESKDFILVLSFNGRQDIQTSSKGEQSTNN